MASLLQSEATRDAERILRDYWWSTPKGFYLPVDPVRIASELGIAVYVRTLEPGISGALVKQLGDDPTILLNETDSPTRRRFTCAHEIGHFVRRNEDLEQYDYVDLRDDLSTRGTDPEEIYANAFAAALLMPEKQVRAAFDEDSDELRLAKQFGVSRDAMNIRLVTLGY